MRRDQFLAILRFLHDNDETYNNRLVKVKYLVDYLNNTRKNIYAPEDRLSLVESLTLWRGRFIFRQYIKNKGHMYGIKLFVLCQYDGVILRVSVYSGPPSNDDIHSGQTGTIVLQLAHDFLDNVYSLFIDNCYNSVTLATYLAKRSIYICSTLRSDGKGNPHAVTEANLKKGEFVWC